MKTAIIFFVLVSSIPSKISSFLRIDTTFLHRFTKRGVTDKIAALVSVENGVICDVLKVNIGARLARTIKQNASAPPNTPNLHNTRATGAIIRDIPTILSDTQMSGLRKIRTADSAEKPIHKISLISLFFRSKKEASPSITNAAIIRTIVISDKASNMEHHSDIHRGYSHFPELVEQFYIVETGIACCEVLLGMARSQNQEIHSILFYSIDCCHGSCDFDPVSSHTSISTTNYSYIF